MYYLNAAQDKVFQVTTDQYGRTHIEDAAGVYEPIHDEDPIVLNGATAYDIFWQAMEKAIPNNPDYAAAWAWAI